MKSISRSFYVQCFCATFLASMMPSVSLGQFELEARAGIGGAAMYSGDYEHTPPFVVARSVRSDVIFHSVAAAAPFALGAFTTGHTIAGEPGFNASASFTNAAIVFDDSDNLRSLIRSPSVPLEVFVHFRADVDTILLPRITPYSPQAHANLSIRSPGSTGIGTSGYHWNLSRGRQLSTGMFRDFSANGGEVEFSVPLRGITPYEPDRLMAQLNASVSVFSAAILETREYCNIIHLALPDGGPRRTDSCRRSIT